MKKTRFDVMPDGTAVEQYTLCNGPMSCDILTYGGALRALRVPDRDGNPVDVVLGFDTLAGYRQQKIYIGALIGRYANRISGAAFALNGTRYPLAANDGTNHLHGGYMGFDKQLWQAVSCDDRSLTLHLVSPDGQEGYPGTLDVHVTYMLTENALQLEYTAAADRDTLCNLTNHAYFNLNGHRSGSICDQQLRLLAQYYTPTDAHSIPNGTLCKVEGTPMDFRERRTIGQHIDDAHEQLRFAGGYDHNWCIDGTGFRLAAQAYGPQTGILMEMLTTQPGIQFFSGNYCGEPLKGKEGASYGYRSGFCLETQCYPDSPHHAAFPKSVLRANEVYHETTVYRFGIE